MLKRLRWLMVLLVVALTGLMVTACGGTKPAAPAKFTSVQTPFHGAVAKVCSGLTDTCVIKPAIEAQSADVAASDFAGSWGGVAGCRIPDVSSYQGTVDWNAARGSICGAVFKGGEYVQDPYAARNNSELARLHIWRAMYWFVRDTGCNHESNQLISLARSFGVKVVANDIEVPEALGYAGCLVPRERAAGLVPVNYTGPGTWPGGAGFANAPLWQAEYGPTLHPFWRPVVAWQCTDGVYGCATYVPGIGQDDVSVNMGITSLGGPPPDPFRIFPTSTIHSPFGNLNERSLILHYLGAMHHPVRYAKYLRYVLEPQLGYTAHRIAWLAFHVWGSAKHANWTFNDGGSRFQYEIKASAGAAIRVK